MIKKQITLISDHAYMSHLCSPASFFYHLVLIVTHSFKGIGQTFNKLNYWFRFRGTVNNSGKHIITDTKQVCNLLAIHAGVNNFFNFYGRITRIVPNTLSFKVNCFFVHVYYYIHMWVFVNFYLFILPIYEYLGRSKHE